MPSLKPNRSTLAFAAIIAFDESGETRAAIFGATRSATEQCSDHRRSPFGTDADDIAALLGRRLVRENRYADVVNQAGVWVKDRDEKTGNRYYQMIEQRCAKTEIGRADTAKHWFVDQEGPWSKAEQEAYQALHKALDLEHSTN